MKKYVIFDFDGTLTKKDTTYLILISLARHRPTRLFSAIPDIFNCFISRNAPYSLQIAKCNAIGKLLGGITLVELNPIISYYVSKANKLIRNKIYFYLQDHRNQGKEILIVTASPRFFVEKLFDSSSITIIGTEFCLVNDHFTEYTEGPPCFAEFKVDAIKSWFIKTNNPMFIEEAWSDSWSDAPMMFLAKKRCWVCKNDLINSIKTYDPEGIIFPVN